MSSLVAAREARAALLASTGRGLLETSDRLRRVVAEDEAPTDAVVVRRSSEHLALLGRDLLDLGRIESGELSVALEDVSVEAVLVAAVADGCVDPDRVEIDAAARCLRSVRTQLSSGGLSSRRSSRHSTRPRPDMRVRVVAGAVWPGVDVRIIDRGARQSRRPGTAATPGAGAFVAQAFVIAIRGQVEIDETPGGGTTLVIRLPAADPVTIPGTRA